VSALEDIGNGFIQRLAYVGQLSVQFWSGLLIIPRTLPSVGRRGHWIAAIQQMATIGVHGVAINLQSIRSTNSENINYSLENIRVISDNLNNFTRTIKQEPWSWFESNSLKTDKSPNGTINEAEVICGRMCFDCGADDDELWQSSIWELLHPRAGAYSSTAGDGGRMLGTLVVRDFETAAYLRQGRIVYRESPIRVSYYKYHRWITTRARLLRRPSSAPCAPPVYFRR